MEDISNITAEQEQTSDGFMDGWEDEPVPAEADQPEAEAEVQRQPEAEPAVDEMSAGGEESLRLEGGAQELVQAQQTADAPEESVQHPRVWDLRYMDEVRQVSEEEIVPLAQKGLDYDRIRARYDESKPVMELFGGFAQQAGMTIPEYVAHIRMQAKQAQGLSERSARREAEREEKTNMEQEELRREADLLEFQRRYPEAARTPEVIPQQVWDRVRTGDTLTNAYGVYLQLTQAGEVQNALNEARSTGSMQSTGGLGPQDPFLSGWYSE